MDITETTAARSDQQNFDDYANGVTRTVTVAEVRTGSAEQPVEIHLVEYPGRPFKPSKTVRRVLVAAWGAEASNYAGRRMTLYGDPTVRFGGAVVGGIRVSHLSHIDKKLTLPVTVTRGKRAPYVVEPLIEASKIRLDEAKIATSTREQCTQARAYLAKYEQSEPDRVAELVVAVAAREAALAEETDS